MRRIRTSLLFYFQAVHQNHFCFQFEHLFFFSQRCVFLLQRCNPICIYSSSFGLFLLEFLTDWQCLLISSLCHIMPWPALLSDLVLLPSLTTSHSSVLDIMKYSPASTIKQQPIATVRKEVLRRRLRWCCARCMKNGIRKAPRRVPCYKSFFLFTCTCIIEHLFANVHIGKLHKKNPVISTRSLLKIIFLG